MLFPCHESRLVFFFKYKKYRGVKAWRDHISKVQKRSACFSDELFALVLEL
jgi:hypothetical protein